MTSAHDFEMRTIDGGTRSLAEYRGKVLLVVNVASKCGLTPQYAGLEQLYRAKHAAGLEVLGFPCNQFGAQEPGTEAEIRRFCETTYDVTFPLFAKVDVNGAARAPLYAYLATQPTAPEGPGDLTWNFGKFVVGKDGRVVARVSPPTKPDDPALLAALDAALAG